MKSWLGILIVLTACGSSEKTPSLPPTPEDPIGEGATKADGVCTYTCNNYGFSAGQCYYGWQCDPAGKCLSYVGTQYAPTTCPPLQPPCTPTTCAARGASCGSISNGCGGTLQCGNCAGSETCGGGGTANVCGCVPKTCAQLSATCGSVSDGCGGTLDCGGCSDAGATCGGGGIPNVCGNWRSGLPEGAVNSTYHVSLTCSDWNSVSTTPLTYGAAMTVTITGNNPGPLVATVDVNEVPPMPVDATGHFQYSWPNAHGSGSVDGSISGARLYVNEGDSWTFPSSGYACSGSYPSP